MKVDDCFRIKMVKSKQSDVIYQALMVNDDQKWVTAKVIHPVYLAEKLNLEGVFKIFVPGLDIEVLGNLKDGGITQALYG